MIRTSDFFNILKKNNIHFFTGVPDSLLKDICSFITDEVSKDKHIIASNEGGAVGLAMGYHLVTGQVPLVYMQNSGFGNTINPLLSLADKKVYSIPMILLIGWRGEPNVKDEPQHVKQGEVSEDLLKTLGVPYLIISENSAKYSDKISKAITQIKETNEPLAILVRKGTFEPYSLKSKIKTNFDLNREEAISKILEFLKDDDIVVGTTGKTSRELFELREVQGKDHSRDFLTVGGMGHANQIALGIALSKPSREIYCFDGDGAILMHTGSLGIIGDLKPENFKHIVFNNGAHDSVGGQPTIGFDISFSGLASLFNYKSTYSVNNKKELLEVFSEFQKSKGPSLLEIKVNKGSRKDLGRPTISPKENKLDFMNFLYS